jgi:hypothetical protein
VIEQTVGAERGPILLTISGMLFYIGSMMKKGIIRILDTTGAGEMLPKKDLT